MQDRRLLRPRISMVPRFFQCLCELVHTCLYVPRKTLAGKLNASVWSGDSGATGRPLSFGAVCSFGQGCRFSGMPGGLVFLAGAMEPIPALPICFVAKGGLPQKPS